MKTITFPIVVSRTFFRCFYLSVAMVSQFSVVGLLQASQNATAPSDPAVAGLVAAYAFDEGMGMTTSDASGNGNDGTITGATWTSQGRFGNALSFTSPNWVTVNDADSLDLSTGMTLEAWIYPTATPFTWTTVLFKEKPEVTNQAYGLYGGSPFNLPLVDVYTSNINELYGPTALPINEWTFLAATYDAVGGLSLYVGNTEVAHVAVTGNIASSTGPLRIGGNSLFNEFFFGVIDNVRIYNRALSQTELQTDMNLAVSETPVPTPTPTPGPCASDSSYWAGHPGAWCVSSMQLGCRTYSFSETVGIIRHNSAHDKTYSLAKNLIAAKLNVTCRNTNPSCVTSAIAAADAWLCTYPIGSGVIANSAAWKLVNKTNTALEKYNSGQSCAPSCGF